MTLEPDRRAANTPDGNVRSGVTSETWVSGSFWCVECQSRFDGEGLHPIGCPLCGADLEATA